MTQKKKFPPRLKKDGGAAKFKLGDLICRSYYTMNGRFKKGDYAIVIKYTSPFQMEVALQRTGEYHVAYEQYWHLVE
jgi:hypothetical protein